MMAFIYMMVVFVKKLIWGNPVQGYPSLLVIILFLGGIQLLSLGIIGEYIGRIYSESKNRPDYFVDEYNEEKVI
jgi:glycosyltransferase involved in cell wall biosynthesis